MKDCTAGRHVRLEKRSFIHHLDYFKQPPVDLYPQTAFPRLSLSQTLHGEDVTHFPHLKSQQCWSKWFTDGPIKTIVFNGRVRRKQCDRDGMIDLCDVKLHPHSPHLQANWMKTESPLMEPFTDQCERLRTRTGQDMQGHATVLNLGIWMLMLFILTSPFIWGDHHGIDQNIYAVMKAFPWSIFKAILWSFV